MEYLSGGQLGINDFEYVLVIKDDMTGYTWLMSYVVPDSKVATGHLPKCMALVVSWYS